MRCLTETDVQNKENNPKLIFFDQHPRPRNHPSQAFSFVRVGLLEKIEKKKKKKKKNDDPGNTLL